MVYQATNNAMPPLRRANTCPAAVETSVQRMMNVPENEAMDYSVQWAAEVVVVVEEVEHEDDSNYSLAEIDFSCRFDESMIKHSTRRGSQENIYSQDVIFSSIESSEVLDSVRRSEDDTFVNVWTA